MAAPLVITTGLDDPRLEAYRDIVTPEALQARGLFVAEGRLVVDRLVRGGRHLVHSLLLTDTAAAAMAPTLTALDLATPVFVVPQAVMNSVVGFNIHRGCLGLAARPVAPPFEALPWTTLARVVVGEGVNNPDNIGSLFRNAAALGAEAVVLGPGCADPLLPEGHPHVDGRHPEPAVGDHGQLARCPRCAARRRAHRDRLLPRRRRRVALRRGAAGARRRARWRRRRWPVTAAARALRRPHRARADAR